VKVRGKIGLLEEGKFVEMSICESEGENWTPRGREVCGNGYLCK
jgi:hypothetical protein